MALDTNSLPLVSVMTPCFNGEDYLQAYLDSLVNQTYKNIELIFVNDGSTDKTEDILFSYKEQFKSNNIKLIYIKQKNKGQSAAINAALKKFTGKYLAWPDADDIMHPDNIAVKVEYFEKNPNCNVVLCACQYFDESNNVLHTFRRAKSDIENIFEDLILEHNPIFTGGAFMVRSSAFKKSIPNLHIYESRGGQNWQLILPILYSNVCAYIDQVLHFIYVRKDSHSRSDNTIQKILDKHAMHEAILKNTIDSIEDMPSKDKKEWHRIIECKYDKKRLRLYTEMPNPEDAKKYYERLKRNGEVNLNDKVYYLACKNKVVKQCVDAILPVYLRLKRLKPN